MLHSVKLGEAQKRLIKKTNNKTKASQTMTRLSVSCVDQASKIRNPVCQRLSGRVPCEICDMMLSLFNRYLWASVGMLSQLLPNVFCIVVVLCGEVVSSNLSSAGHISEGRQIGQIT